MPRAESPPDPRLAEFIERLAEALVADHARALASGKPQPKAAPPRNKVTALERRADVAVHMKKAA